jgi:hypothetical protein
MNLKQKSRSNLLIPSGFFTYLSFGHSAWCSLCVECFVRISEQRQTYLLTPWSTVLLEKLTSLQLVKKFPAFYGTRRFITALTSARHLSLSSARPIPSTHSHPASRRSVLILSSHLCLGLPSGILPNQNPVRISPLPHTRYMPCPSRSSRFYHPPNIE